MSGSYLLSPLALADQADAYVLAIHAACEALAQMLAKGRSGGQRAEHIRKRI